MYKLLPRNEVISVFRYYHESFSNCTPFPGGDKSHASGGAGCDSNFFIRLVSRDYYRIFLMSESVGDRGSLMWDESLVGVAHVSNFSFTFFYVHRSCRIFGSSGFIGETG